MAEKKLTKNQKALIRVVTAIVLFGAAFITEKVLDAKAIDTSVWMWLGIYLAIYLFIGWDVAFRAVTGVFRGELLDENFLMFIATVGAFAVREFPEAVAVMAFYQLGELFQNYAVGKSRASIASLMDIRPDVATVIRGGEEIVVDPEEVEIGEIILVRPGEKIPLDGVVVEGTGTLNTAALTGESAPVDVAPGSEVISGSISVSAAFKIRSTKAFGESTVSKILDLVENASSEKAKAENFITKFARYYTPAVVIGAVLLAVVPPLFLGISDGTVWMSWLTRALSFLVVSCPCALVISVPLSFFGAIGGASKAGILVKGGNYLEVLNETDVFVMDKTGTITKGSFEVKKVLPEAKRDEILAAAAIAERLSTHPIARSIEEATGGEAPSDYRIEEIAGEGVKAARGEEVIYAGNKRLMARAGVAAEDINEVGTIVYVAKNGEYLGAIVIGDTIKPDSARAIAELKAEGSRTVMLTGDNEKTAAAIAAEAGVDEYASGLLPAGKVEHIGKYLGRKRKTAFVGDGINDAPVLMRADVGLAMGALGSDSAIEAADIVLMNDSLASIPVAKRIAKKTMRIVYENIVFALGVKAAILILSALGITGMWLAIFADVGVAVLAILNAMRMLRANKLVEKTKKDKAAA
ncbi:MAG TPA: cadmium-translocating P-type ATPase [Clostridiales bacterium]|nr:cadmium-translocating P-type ATPase [Clostridiales bacterium]